MKLLTVCDILNDETFLVELLDDDLTFAALKRVIQDRGIIMERYAYSSGLFPRAALPCVQKRAID
jgi:hypothetical protein